MFDLTPAGRARCLVVWLLATGATTATVVWVAPDLRSVRSASDFDDLVVGVAAAALVGCVAWAWLVTGIVVLQALGGRPHEATRGVPRRLRVAVLVACGVALAGPAAAAQAHDGGRPDPRDVLAGLPPPERVAGAVPADREPTGRPVEVHVVRSGDTLWDIAAAGLGGRADPTRITERWQAIHAVNASVIGADPDLIRPGQRLRLPLEPTRQREEQR